jgi:serine/threonine protein kinase
MSPEQSVGAEIDSRSDIFSIGVVLYEVVTGKRMYGNANQLAILHKLLNFHIDPPSALNPECPPELEHIIMRALQPNPENRYQSAAELQLDLETFAHSSGLFLSSVRLSKFMRVLFGDKPEPWAEETAMTRIQQTTGRAQLLDQLEDSKPHSAPKIVAPVPSQPQPTRRWGLIVGMLLTLLAGAGALLFYTGVLELPGGSHADEAGESMPQPAAAPDPQPSESNPDERREGNAAPTDSAEPPIQEGPVADAAPPESDDSNPQEDSDAVATEPELDKSKGKSGKGKSGKGKSGKGKSGKSNGDGTGDNGPANPYDAYELPGE